MKVFKTSTIMGKLSIFTILAVIATVEAQWVQIRQEVPNPGEENHNKLYRGLKPNHVLMMDDVGRALGMPEELNGNQEKNQDGISVQKPKSLGNDGSTAGGKTLEGKYTQVSLDLQKVSKQATSFGGNGNTVGSVGTPLNARKLPSSKEELDEAINLANLMESPNYVKPKSKPLFGARGGETSLPVINYCNPNDPPKGDRKRPEVFYLCIKFDRAAKNWYRVELKCSIGTFHELEQACIWKRPLPEEPTVHQCQYKMQVLNSNKDCRCYYLCKPSYQENEYSLEHFCQATC